jgi:hypothetical protein
MNISRRDVIAGAVGTTVGAGALSLVGLANRAASVDAAASRLSLRIEGDFRVLESNGLPGHAIGDFPNRHDPVAVRPQSHKLRMPAKPIQNENPLPINMWWFGVAVNGVPFRPDHSGTAMLPLAGSLKSCIRRILLH